MELLCRIGDDMTIEKRIVEAPYMTSALRREAAEEITRLRNALAQSVKIGAEHREGRLKALEWMAALESRLREDLKRERAVKTDLLEALIELADCGAKAWGEDRPCVKRARVVIAKATGEQP